jgi:hypothetical protein
MLQGVGDLFELRKIEQERPKKMANFLFVGRGIDPEKVRIDLTACLKK